MRHFLLMILSASLFWAETALGADTTRRPLLAEAEAKFTAQLKSDQYPSLDSILVLQGGDLLYQHYKTGHWPDRLHQMRSVTKAIGGLLVGIAIDQGKITSLDDPVPGAGHEVSWRHLLTMSGGFDCDDLDKARACLRPFYQSADWLAYMRKMDITRPHGKSWSYNSGSLILLSHGLEQVTGAKLEDWAQQHLFAPMGIKTVLWRHSPEGIAWLGGGMRMRPEDLAKIGQLILTQGKWGDRQLVSADWIRQMTTSQMPTNLDWDYGFLWWHAGIETRDHCHPLLFAAGGGGQRLYILPELDLVTLLMASNYKGEFKDPSEEILLKQVIPMIPGHFDPEGASLGPPCAR